MKNKLLFIHIAKTGGSSVRQMFNKSNPPIAFDCIHNGKLISFNDNKIIRKPIHSKVIADDYRHTIYFVRNPYDRLQSCYKYFFSGGLSQFNNNVKNLDKQTQKTIIEEFPSFRACCNNLQAFNELVSHAEPMTNSILNNCVLPENQSSITEGRFELYNESVIKIFSTFKLTIKPHNILKTNSSTNSNDFHYDDKMKEKVYQYYKSDFEYFRYQK